MDVQLIEPYLVPSRDCHGYGNTRGVSKTGNAGTGTVLHFGIPRHTATRTRGIILSFHQLHLLQS
jgi:hypothetical protein